MENAFVDGATGRAPLSHQSGGQCVGEAFNFSCSRG